MEHGILEERVSLKTQTTLKVGGTARYFITAHSEAVVVEAVAFAKERQLPLFVLGAGSNVLVPDGEYPGVVVKIAIRGIETTLDEASQTVTCVAGAGEDLDTFIAATIKRGWWGLENLSAIPSSIGAVPVQNVGAYGVEASQVVDSVRVYDIARQTFVTLKNTECAFAYRDSVFKHEAGKGYIVTAVTFLLSTKPHPQLLYKDLATYFGDAVPDVAAVREAVIAIRANKFPDWTIIGTAGSFFKNPIIETAVADRLLALYPDLPVYSGPNELTKKVSLGFILDKVCGLKGYSERGVTLYEKQALVLTAAPTATATDVITFAHMIAEKVFVATNISIEWEVVVLK